MLSLIIDEIGAKLGPFVPIVVAVIVCINQWGLEYFKLKTKNPKVNPNTTDVTAKDIRKTTYQKWGGFLFWLNFGCIVYSGFLIVNRINHPSKTVNFDAFIIALNVATIFFVILMSFLIKLVNAIFGNTKAIFSLAKMFDMYFNKKEADSVVTSTQIKEILNELESSKLKKTKSKKQL